MSTLDSSNTNHTPQWNTFCLEDTISIKDEPDKIGYVTHTWHQPDHNYDFESQNLASYGSEDVQDIIKNFVTNGELPRGYAIINILSKPGWPTVIHEKHLVLLERHFDFGNSVKRKLTDSQSGVVINLGGKVDIEPQLQERRELATGSDFVTIQDVDVDDLDVPTYWEEGEYVIWKNCWLGVIEDIIEDVAVRVDSGVVIVDDPSALKLMYSNAEDTTQPIRSPGLASDWMPNSAVTGAEYSDTGRFAAGQHVGTTKMNLRRGRWRYGAYDPNVNPNSGYVVDVQLKAVLVHWLCQNMMIPDKFVPVEPPEPWQEAEEIHSDLKLFKRTKGAGGDRRAHVAQVGEVVCFNDIAAACVKYNTSEREEKSMGRINRISRASMLGYDVNNFRILKSRLWVDVQWQDRTVTRELATNLVSYEHLDEHDMWPGDIVVMKSEGEQTSQPLPQNTPLAHRRRTSAANEAVMSQSATSDMDEMTMLSPKKVGVVQTVDSQARTTQIRWFEGPKLEIVGDMIIPGSSTGPLSSDPAETVSVYELSVVPALSMRRGDTVLIAPEFDASLNNDSDRQRASSTESVNNNRTESNGTGAAAQTSLQWMMESLRGMVDTGLLSNLSASLANTSSPQFQHLSSMLNQLPQSLTQHNVVPSFPPALPPLPEGPIEWFGEIVDMEDGIYTVRLGALDQVREIKTPIERLTVVLDDEALDDGGSEMEDIMYDSDSSEDTDSQSDGSMDEDWITEEIIYEGGNRKDIGPEADWLTDDEDGDAMEIDDDKVKGEQRQSPTQIPTSMSSTFLSETPDGSKTTSINAPECFQILEGEIPSDHAFASQPPTLSTPAFLRRIKKEHKILSSLPDGIYVRTWDTRLDLLRVLIIGPKETPYMFAPFVFDFHLGADFPVAPPNAYFHSWTNSLGRVNPNLYENGKICLSLLGTWHGEKKSETWTSTSSSLLQILISLMGLVLVHQPYYKDDHANLNKDEAGFGVYVGAQEAVLNSALYSEKAYILSQGFVKRVLEQPVAGLDDVIRWLYLPSCHGLLLLDAVISHIRRIATISEDDVSNIDLSDAQLITHILGPDGPRKLSAGAIVLLRKTLVGLESILAANHASMASNGEGSSLL